MAEPLFTQPIRYSPTSVESESPLLHHDLRHQNELSGVQSLLSQQLSEAVLLAELEEYFPSQRIVNPGSVPIGSQVPVWVSTPLEYHVPEFLLAALVMTWLVPLLWNLWKMLAVL